MDEKSTPLASLNNKNDDSEVVNKILDKYNSLEQNPDGTLPPQDQNIQQMENEFENRDMNQQMNQMSLDNTQYKAHSESEKARINNMRNLMKLNMKKKMNMKNMKLKKCLYGKKL